MLSKSGLAIILSKLKGFDQPKVRVEQYMLDSEIAADILWNTYMKGDLIGKVGADMGCGTGILGLGALLLGAEKVYFVDSDEAAIEAAKANLMQIEQKVNVKVDKKAVFMCQDITEFNNKVDLVLENPPFGTKVRHADRAFLEKALGIAPVVYSVHKITSKGFIEAFSREKGYKVSDIWVYRLPLKATLKWHKRRIHYINVGCWRLEKI